LHRCATLRSGSTTERLRIPVTTPARTIEDLKGLAPPHLVRRATRQAELAKYRLGPGIEGDRTRSDLERDFLRLCRRHGLPAPDEVNVKVGRWTVDFLWRRQRVAVETDFFDYHRGRVAFQDDRARELGLRRHGFAIHRFSEVQIDDEPAEVATDLRDALGLAS
jgi:very-short-patch-repair endonuclease